MTASVVKRRRLAGNGERRLCRAIFILTIRDATSKDRRERAAALAWLMNESWYRHPFSLENLCSYIFDGDCDPTYIRNGIMRMIADDGGRKRMRMERIKRMVEDADCG